MAFRPCSFFNSRLAGGHRMPPEVGGAPDPSPYISFYNKRKIYMRNKEWGWVGWVPPFPHAGGQHGAHVPNVS
jgi:hypothetical protein